MKHMLKLIGLILTAAIALSYFCVTAAALRYRRGDADGDGEVTIQDCTLVQKLLVQVYEEEYDEELYNDVAMRCTMVTDELSILDVTMMQRYVALMEVPYGVGEYVGDDPTEPPTEAPTSAPTQKPTTAFKPGENELPVIPNR